MTRRLALLVTILAVLAVCACGGPRIPDWRIDGYNNLEAFKDRYLTGSDRAAEASWRKAEEAIKSSGDLEVLGRAHLTRYAVLTACLETFDDMAYRDLEALRPVPENRAFHRFLAGRLSEVDDRSLPEAYRGVQGALRKGNAEQIDREIARIADPLSRLVAAGVAVRTGHSDEALLRAGLETASQNGWKRAVLAYLERLQALYQKEGKAEQAGKALKTMEILKRRDPS